MIAFAGEATQNKDKKISVTKRISVNSNGGLTPRNEAICPPVLMSQVFRSTQKDAIDRVFSQAQAVLISPRVLFKLYCRVHVDYTLAFSFFIRGSTG